MSRDEMEVEVKVQAGWLFDKGLTPNFSLLADDCRMKYGPEFPACRFAAMVVSTLRRIESDWEDRCRQLDAIVSIA